MPEIRDALDVITDPANVHRDDAHTGERRINVKRVTKALRGMGAKPAEARELIRQAVEELGGRADIEMNVSGRGAGPDARSAQDTWFVPAEKVRKY